MVEASPILASTPSTVITTLARYRAMRTVKRQLQARGLKLRNFTAAALRVQANEYLAEHRAALLAEATEMVRDCAELRKLYDREQRERQRWLERNLTVMHTARMPDPKGIFAAQMSRPKWA